MQFGINSIGVPAVSTQSSLSVINYSFWQRFGLFNPLNFKEGFYCILRPNANNYLDYNVWLYTIKCSVLGEYSYWGGEIYLQILVYINFVLILYTLYTIVNVLIRERKKETRYMNYLMLLIFVESLVAYIFFQITNPVTCTQDFRYMTFILIPGTYFIAKERETISDGSKLSARKILLYALVVVFISTSFLAFVSAR